MKIIIVDDCISFSKGLIKYIEEDLGHKVIGCFENGEEFLAYPYYHKADIVLMDVEMPVINGIKTTKLALQEYNHLKIIAITEHYSNAYLVELIGAGFKACVFKKNLFDTLDITMKEVAKGKLHYPDDIEISRD